MVYFVEWIKFCFGEREVKTHYFRVFALICLYYAVIYTQAYLRFWLFDLVESTLWESALLESLALSLVTVLHVGFLIALVWLVKDIVYFTYLYLDSMVQLNTRLKSKNKKHTIDFCIKELKESLEKSGDGNIESHQLCWTIARLFRSSMNPYKVLVQLEDHLGEYFVDLMFYTGSIIIGDTSAYIVLTYKLSSGGNRTKKIDLWKMPFGSRKA